MILQYGLVLAPVKIFHLAYPPPALGGGHNSCTLAVNVLAVSAALPIPAADLTHRFCSVLLPVNGGKLAGSKADIEPSNMVWRQWCLM